MQSDTALLNCKLRTDEHVRLEQNFEPSEDGWRLLRAQLTRIRGMGYTSDITPTTAKFLHHCNGTRTVSEILREVASPQQDSREISAECLPALRSLIARGFLVPIE